MSVNKVILIGRFGKDPECFYVGDENKTPKTNFSLATDRQWKDKDGNKEKTVTWHNMVAWGKTAELIAEYFHKGDQIYLEGRIDNRSYDDKDGNKKYVSEVVVESFSFIGGNKPKDETSERGNKDDDDSLPF